MSRERPRVGDVVQGPCPTCGVVASRRTYDVGSGPELSCANCEWCWGAEGQDLIPLTIGDLFRGAHRTQQEEEKGNRDDRPTGTR